MSRIQAMLFSNGTEHMSWVSRNCERCWKLSKYNEKKGTWSQFRCSIDKQIQMQLAGVDDGYVSKKAYDAVRLPDCPYIETQRKVKKKKVAKNQQTLELF